MFGMCMLWVAILWIPVDRVIDAINERRQSELALREAESAHKEYRAHAPSHVCGTPSQTEDPPSQKKWWEEENDEDPYRGMYQIFGHRYAETFLITDDGAKMTGGHGGINVTDEGQYKSTILALREKGLLKPGDRVTFTSGKDRVQRDVVAVDVSEYDREPGLIEPLLDLFCPRYTACSHFHEKDVNYLLFRK